MARNPAKRPHTEGTKGIRHTDNYDIYSGNKGENPETILESRRDPLRMWTIEDGCRHRLTNTRSKHALAELQGNADP